MTTGGADQLRDFDEVLSESLDSVFWNPDEFRIDSDVKAEWAVRKLRDMRAERDRLVDTMRAVMDEYAKRIAEEEEKYERRAVRMRNMLEDYFESVPHKVTKTQESYQLPSGRLVLKAMEPEFRRDEAALVDWLKAGEMDSCIETRTAVKWGDPKKNTTVMPDGKVVYNATGEVIDGVTAVSRPAEFRVTTK